MGAWDRREDLRNPQRFKREAQTPLDGFRSVSFAPVFALQKAADFETATSFVVPPGQPAASDPLAVGLQKQNPTTAPPFCDRVRRRFADAETLRLDRVHVISPENAVDFSPAL
jgi:hypothetical protein